MRSLVRSSSTRMLDVVRIAWIADSPTNGPLVRAEAVMTRRDLDVDGLVLSFRARESFGRLLDRGVECVSVGCCGDDHVRRVLARADVDVVVADWQSWRIAEADRRPHMLIGFAHRASEGLMWDLDDAPLHPWGRDPWFTVPARERRARDRAALGIGLDELVVVTMSSTTFPGSVESRVLPRIGHDVRLVRAHSAYDFGIADLVVTNAGWSAATEARWSGVPHFLLMLGGLDQPARARPLDELVDVLDNLTPHEPDDDDPAPVDHVPDFVDALGLTLERENA